MALLLLTYMEWDHTISLQTVRTSCARIRQMSWNITKRLIEKHSFNGSLTFTHSGSGGNFPFGDEPINLDAQTDSPMPDMQSNMNGMMNQLMQNGQNPGNQGTGNQFASNQRPSSNYQNLPPIIQQIIDTAVPPPSPILADQMNVWYYDPTKQPNTDNVLNMANKPSTEKPSEESNISSEKPSQEPAETPASTIQTTPVSVQKPVPQDVNGNVIVMTHTPVSTRPVNSIFLHSSAPLFQAAYYNQYNSFIPYIPPGIYNQRFPFNQNIPPQNFNGPMNSENNSQKLTKDIIIKVGEFRT